MVRLGHRRRLAGSALAVVVTGVVAGCDGRGDVEVTSTTSGAVEPLPSRGPGLGTFEADWQVEVATGRSRVVGAR